MLEVFLLWPPFQNGRKMLDNKAQTFHTLKFSPSRRLLLPCMHSPSLVLTFLHLYALSLTCMHSPSFVHTLLHLYTHSFTCTHSPSLVRTFFHLYAASCTCTHSASLVCTRLHLFAFSFTCTHFPSGFYKLTGFYRVLVPFYLSVMSSV